MTPGRRLPTVRSRPSINESHKTFGHRKCSRALDLDCRGRSRSAAVPCRPDRHVLCASRCRSKRTFPVQADILTARDLRAARVRTRSSKLDAVSSSHVPAACDSLSPSAGCPPGGYPAAPVTSDQHAASRGKAMPAKRQLSANTHVLTVATRYDHCPWLKNAGGWK
jgi:hypothetical protein